MELRRTFSAPDLKYLANLCHNCRDCYYACQYAPPHPFALNVPQTLGELRLACYKEFCWPALLSGVFRRNGLAVFLTAVLSVAAVLLFTVLFKGFPVLFGRHTGENAFYHVIPYTTIVLTFGTLAGMILVSFWKSVGRWWRETGGKPGRMSGLRAHKQAVWDALRLKYLDGGGEGCNYPDERFSMARRYYHHAVSDGFMCCLASTAVAAFYHHFLHLPAPYPFFSWPVMLGTVGGLSLIIGTSGLLYLKGRMDKAPAAPRSIGLDVGFLVLLFSTSLTGLLLLLLRDTPLMGFLLAVHIGVVAGLFFAMPYGKFTHAVYRYLALVRNAMEQ